MDRGGLNMESQQTSDQAVASNRTHVPTGTSQSTDWYAEGEERIVEADGIQVVVRLVGRKGRRARIKFTAPPGTAFRACDRKKAVQPRDRVL
jgi:hypothetical protein